jgi:hypothetical protein
MELEIWHVAAAWLLISGSILWFLARWSATKRRHGSLTVIAIAATLYVLGLVAYAFLLAESVVARPRNWLETTAIVGEVSFQAIFLLWPFLSTIAIAQVVLRVAANSRLARWLAFGGGLVIASLMPLAMLVVGCGLAGACI